ncbi:DNA repair protein rhp54 [Sphaceloma murrayae]|uniref:DNA repair protein rhp54 n=1 Tax=Sphaceloma murrayae TaxID=2082308 RepID=A0A2K1QLN9_9PEZI|nr:DNA repair protein rhp54 [Sphaceloma murrayae]
MTNPPLQAIFRGLQGTWTLRRSLTSKLPGYPCGTFEGSATFSPSDAFNKSAYLYHETGTLVTDQGFRLVADRKYIYRYSADDEKISAWFVKETSGKDDVDYLYHELEFQREEDRWVARSDHLCVNDI